MIQKLLSLIRGDCVRRIVAVALKRIYGVRGSLKPPLGGQNAGLLYPVRYHAWKVANRIYRWSGLPVQWEQSWRTND
jgi:hypothetical protein